MVSSEYYISDNSDIDNKRLEAAGKLYSSGDYAGALRLYLSMLNTSISYKLYYEIGRCYYKLNDFLPSEEYFKKSIAIESIKNPSYVYLGNIYFKRENSKKSIENWTRAYAYKPDDEAVCLNLATSYFARGMHFQSVLFYDKYLKYAKNRGNSYFTIKNSIEKYKHTAIEFRKKAQIAISNRNTKAAIEFLMFAEKNRPVDFDVNYLLGKTYLEESKSLQALAFFKQAFCIDNKSLDVLQNLSSVYINLGDYTSAYCTMRRLLPLVLHNQNEYLRTLQAVKDLGDTFDDYSYQGHKNWADKYYEENNYHMALIEYENCAMLREEPSDDVIEKIELLKSFTNPEERIIRICLEKGGIHYAKEDFRTSNKYYTRVMTLSHENSAEYKQAKLRVVNV